MPDRRVPVASASTFRAHPAGPALALPAVMVGRTPRLSRALAALVLALASAACGQEQATDAPMCRLRAIDSDLLGASLGWPPRSGTTAAALPGEFQAPRALLMAYSLAAANLTPSIVDVIAAALPHVPSIVIYVRDQPTADTLCSALLDAGVESPAIAFSRAEVDSIWIRDYGPLVVNGPRGPRVVDLYYNAGRSRDDRLSAVLAERWNLPVDELPLQAEGGNLQSDGAGTCLTSEALLDVNGIRAADAGEILSGYFGCDKTVVVPPLYGEPTGHVDMLATITGPREAIVGAYPAGEDPANAARLDIAASRLRHAGFTVRRVPMPTNRDSVFRSHTNSLALGDAVLVPVYQQDRSSRARALEVFREAYPGRTVLPIDATELIRWSGAIHCITMTIGAASPEAPL